MAEYINKTALINSLQNNWGRSASNGDEGECNFWNRMWEEVRKIPAADVVERDEGIRMGAELAAMHGSDATTKQLEESYWKGFEEGVKKSERKTGKWIFDNPLTADFMCDNCLERQDICTPFCSHCGARMEGMSMKEYVGLEAEKTVTDFANRSVSWDWLEDFAKEKKYNIAKHFFSEAKKEWSEELKHRMKSGVFYGD